MIKIGITGSLASGKTTASKFLSLKRGPLFSADEVVKKLYKNKSFKTLISKKFKIKNDNKIKSTLKGLMLNNRFQLNKLEQIIHPLVRKKMKNFTVQNKNKKLLFYEIPLLIESKLTKFFDIIILIKCNKRIRFKRFKLKGGDIKIFSFLIFVIDAKSLFQFLSKKQISDNKKTKVCHYVVVNEKKINIFKKKLLSIITKYE